MSRPTVAIDLDHTIAAQGENSSWPGPPLPGAEKFLRELVNHADVIIHSCRSDCQRQGVKAIQDWFAAHDMRDLLSLIHIQEKGEGKPIAHVYLDDRGWRFTGGEYPSVEELLNTQPWWAKYLPMIGG